MQLYKEEGKNEKEILDKILEKYLLKEDEIIYNIKEEKGRILKGSTFVITASKLDDIAKEASVFLTKLFSFMNIDVIYEYTIIDKQIQISMKSDHNAILIGKNGQTLKALQNILRQYLITNYNLLPYILLDVENYKEQKCHSLEHVARNIAKEVLQTGIDASLDNMNSYERRIVHNALKDIDGINTYSKGKDPNRHVIIEKIKSN